MPGPNCSRSADVSKRSAGWVSVRAGWSGCLPIRTEIGAARGPRPWPKRAGGMGPWACRVMSIVGRAHTLANFRATVNVRRTALVDVVFGAQKIPRLYGWTFSTPEIVIVPAAGRSNRSGGRSWGGYGRAVFNDPTR